jgi:hypothetical protein
MNTDDEITASYVAGFFDGEGTVFIGKSKTPNSHSYSLRVRIGCSDYEPIKVITDFANCGILDTLETHQGRPYYRWRCYDKHVTEFLLRIQPYIRGKKIQVELALEFQKFKKAMLELNRQGIKTQGIEKDVMDGYYKLLKELKLPSESSQEGNKDLREFNNIIRIEGIKKQLAEDEKQLDFFQHPIYEYGGK